MSMASRSPGESRVELEAEQLALELRFCAGLFSGFATYARENLAWLPPEYFLNRSLGDYWRAVRDGKDRVQAANDCGVFAALNEESATLFAFPVEQDAAAIQDLSFMREVLLDLSLMSSDVRSRNIAGLRDKIDKLKVRAMSRGGGGILTATEVSDRFKSYVQSPSKAIMTRLQLDQAIGGLFGSELNILAARPGMGKTAFAMQLARTAAMDKRRVLFVSLEMSVVQLWARMACPTVGLEWRNVRIGNISQVDSGKLQRASDSLANQYQDYLVVDESSYTPSAIHQAALDVKPDFVIVDQLPEIIWHVPGLEAIKWYGEALKYLRTHIARAMDIPVLIIHQLSRSVEDRSDHRPILKDLRESGEIEQRADVVLFIYRDDYYKGRMPGQVNVSAEILVAKNRQGDTAQVKLDYHLKEQWFR